MADAASRAAIPSSLESPGSSRHRPKVFASPPRDWAISFSRLAA